MEKLIGFFDIISYILAVGSFILICGRIYGAVTYTELEKTLDALRGVQGSYPLMGPSIVFTISIAWILS